jgi:uncharacterized protein YbjT (DUF2867 family)
MSKVLIIGGHGQVALLAEPMLSEAGHETTAVVRNPDHVSDIEETGAKAHVADVEKLNQTRINQLVAGYDVVVWSAGAGGGNPNRTKAVDEAAAERVLSAVERTGARFIMVSYFGSTRHHGVPERSGFFAYAEAKSRVDVAIRESKTDWVILAPSNLTLEPEGGIVLDPAVDSAEPSGMVDSDRIPRATVARMITELIARPSIRKVTLRCNSGNTPVSEALDALA